MPRRLTSAQLAERRLQAAAWFRAGTLTQAEIARRLGVSAAAVSHWRAQWQRLLRLLARGAVAAGFETEPWTLPRIARLIAREFGVHYHPRYLARPLHAQGWSPHRPAPQAREREEALITAWLRRDWEGVKRGLVAEGAARGTRLPAW